MGYASRGFGTIVQTQKTCNHAYHDRVPEHDQAGCIVGTGGMAYRHPGGYCIRNQKGFAARQTSHGLCTHRHFAAGILARNAFAVDLRIQAQSSSDFRLFYMAAYGFARHRSRMDIIRFPWTTGAPWPRTRTST